MTCMQVDLDDPCFDKNWLSGEGLQVISYSPDGRYLYSGGTDALLRAWDTEKPGQDPEQIEHFDDGITSLDCSFDAVVACSEDGKTATFEADDTGKHQLQAFITRAAPGMQARHARFGNSGRKIAVASDELLVKIIDTRDTSNIHLLSGHTKAVRAVGWNPDGSLLVTSGCDGMLKVWDTTSSTEQPFCVKTIDGLIASGDASDVLACAALWHPNGKYFVIGTKSHEIAIIARDTWIRTGDFTADGHNADITALAWSPNGNYLASAGADNQLIIWETLTSSPLYRCKWNGSIVTALAWQPGNAANTLSISDASGQLTQWRQTIPSDKLHPSDGPARAVTKDNAQQRAKNEQSHKRHPSKAASESALSEDLMKSDGQPEADTQNDQDDDDNGWIDDDMDGAYTDGPVRHARNDREHSVDDLPPPLDIYGKPIKAVSQKGPLVTAVAGQASFQPGATPFKEKRRYLAFNSVGIIHVVDRDHHNLVSVEFHDRSLHRGYHFEDNYKFSMAALGERGAAYASSGTNDLPSVINYRPFETWTAQADWQYDLPKGESAVAIGVGGVSLNDIDPDLAPCLGSGSVVVGSNAGYLRFFSGSGLQMHLIDLGREIVALTVGKEWAMVMHRSSNVLSDGRQNLAYSIYDCDTFELIQQGDVPMMSGVCLNWIGFTDAQIPAIYKSNGVLSLLNRARRPGQARWIASLDTSTLERREGKQEAYWPVAVTRQYLQCVILKGEDKHPFFPTPLLQDLTLQLPTLGKDEQQGQLEENYLRDSLLNGHIKDGCDPADSASRQALNAAALEIDKHLLKLMQTACKADKLEQALEAARLLGQPQSLDAAAKLAGFFHQPGLQERIQLIKEARTGESAVDRERKESKWGHLVDNRTVVDSLAEAQHYASDASHAHPAKQNGLNDLSKPIDKSTGKRSLGDSSALGAKIVKPLYTRAEDSGHGSSEPEFGGGSDAIEEETEDIGAIQDSPESIRAQPADELIRSKAPNPFAKQNGTKPSNPFAKRHAGKVPASGSHVDLKRSDSFFARVDPEAPKSKGATKQAGLFGKTAKEGGEVPSRRGKKRKATADEEAAAEKAKKAKADAQPGLKTFMTKAAAAAKEAAAEDTAMSVVSETLDDTPVGMQIDDNALTSIVEHVTQPSADVALEDLFNDFTPPIAAA